MIKVSEKKALRNVFGDHLVYLGKKNNKICVVSCDLKSATKTSNFFEAFPKRSFEVGIAEANGLGIATGLALKGFIPIISRLNCLCILWNVPTVACFWPLLPNLYLGGGTNFV